MIEDETAAPLAVRARRERDVCHVLGGLFLDGANIELLGALAQDGTLERVGSAAPEPIGACLAAIHEALNADDSAVIAREYTRLFVATTDGGARLPLLVPPWEDCWLGSERRVLGERSRAVLAFYVAAGLGFDTMTEQPSDHVGLELCFVAALLDEEAAGQRDHSVRDAFARAHIGRLAPRLGEALARESKVAFWGAAGRALVALPGLLGCGNIDEPAQARAVHLPVV